MTLIGLPLHEARERLRRLADDMEEMGRRSGNGNAKAIYYRAADDARSAIRSRHIDEHGLRLVLAACTAQASVAAWHEGDEPIEHSAIQPQERDPAPTAPATQLQPIALPSLPAGALSTSQIADRLGIGERRARRAIKKGVERGLPGFYRTGSRWHAMPDAVEQLLPLSD